MEALVVSVASKLELSLYDHLFDRGFQLFITKTEKIGKERFAKKFAIEADGSSGYLLEDLDTSELWDVLRQLFNRAMLDFQARDNSAYESYLAVATGEHGEEAQSRAIEFVPEDLRRFTRFILTDVKTWLFAEVRMEDWLLNHRPRETPIRRTLLLGYEPQWQ